MIELLTGSAAPASDLATALGHPVGHTVVFTGSRPFAGRILRTWSGPGVAELGASRLAGNQRLLVVLPFEEGGDEVAHLVEPTEIGDLEAPFEAREVARQSKRPAGTSTTAGRTFRVVASPSPAQYADLVRAALARIDAGELAKVVLGRCLEVGMEPPLEPEELLAALAAARPGRYLVGAPLTGGRWLVGASPELLVSRRGSVVTSTPLAGSAPRVPDQAEDNRRAAQLRESAKDLHEHSFVADAIRTALSPVVTELQVPERPTLLSTDTLHHLATPIRARLRRWGPDSLGPSALDLARLLHPTPAVGGVPTPSAAAAIAELEGERGPFAGAVGWVDATGDGEFAVTIRSAVLAGGTVRLFAGAGIVAGSDPEGEVRETGAKLTTIARALGLPEELLP